MVETAIYVACMLHLGIDVLKLVVDNRYAFCYNISIHKQALCNTLQNCGNISKWFVAKGMV